MSTEIFKNNDFDSLSLQYNQGMILFNTLTLNNADIWKVWMKNCIIYYIYYYTIIIWYCLILQTITIALLSFCLIWFIWNVNFKCSSIQTSKCITKQSIHTFPPKYDNFIFGNIEWYFASIKQLQKKRFYYLFYLFINSKLTDWFIFLT